MKKKKGSLGSVRDFCKINEFKPVDIKYVIFSKRF